MVGLGLKCEVGLGVQWAWQVGCSGLCSAAWWQSGFLGWPCVLVALCPVVVSGGFLWRWRLAYGRQFKLGRLA